MKNYQSITIHHNVDDDDAQQNCPTTSTTNNDIHLHLIKNTVTTTLDNAKYEHQPSYNHLQEEEEDHLVPPFNSPLRPSNVIVGAFNLTATIIGGGVLSLPIVFQKCGIFVTTVAMCFSAYTTYMSLIFLCYCSRRGGGSSYGEVVRSAFGESMEEGVSWLLCIYLILSIVAYMILARDVWSPLVREVLNIDTMNGDNYVLLGIMVVLLPFLFQRSLHALRKICYIGFASIFVLCIALCRGGYDKMKHHDEMREGGDDTSFHIEIFKIPSPQDLLFSFPIITCAFLCHFNIIAIQNALQKPTRQRMQVLIKYAIGACFILMYMFGLGGYVYGGNHTQGNILLNVPTKPGEDNDYFLFLLGRIGCGITIMIAMPLNLLPCREALLEVVDVRFHYSHHRADQEGSNPEEQGCWRIFHRLNSTEDVEDALITTEDELVEIVGNREEFSQELEVNERSTIHRTELIRHDPIQRDYIFQNTLAHYGSTVLITVICYFGAVCVEGVATVWSFIGSSMAFFIAFVLPSGCFIVLESAVSVGDRHDAWIKFAWVILIFSIIGAFVCTTNTMFGRYLWLEEDSHDQVL